jgi:protein phosphatase PTC1
MSDVGTKQSPNLAGNKRRSLSGQGGLLGRMFGSGKESSKEALDTSVGAGDTETTGSPRTASPMSSAPRDDLTADLKSPSRKGSQDSNLSGPGDKKRRSSGNGRVRDLLSSAKQSLSNLGGSDKSSSERNQSPMQKLGKSDPALNVPQGSLNNSAGESAPGPRSTFRVGVTEDKNKKCRRTMEDTHAYLYNFLSTPAPNITPVPNAPLTRAPTGFSLFESKTNDSTATDLSLSPRVSVGNKDMVETDNGYFAIFDGHAGTFAADWCGKKVHLLLEDIIRKNPNSPIPELLDQTFTLVDQQLEKLPLKNSGTTAVVAVLRWEDRIPNSQSATGSTAIAPATAQAASQGENADSTPPDQLESKLRESASRQRVLYTANVGDARIILCRNGKALRLSYDHKGGDENEGKRIAGAGGLILNNRVNGVLAVTRALGDAYMKDLVTGHPYTTETVIQPDIDEFLILACDGVSDIGERDPDTLTGPLLTYLPLALGRVLRSGSRRPRPQRPGPSTWLQDAGRSRPRPLLHRQPLVYDGAIRHDCPTSSAGEQGQPHWRRG